ncbi:hypothetical protein MSPP1_003244 [Malassezia sp. CBS 17886]|nr:hypothetical protein MSPP1_003244 [Malassezia sp. CBS 17886]
MTPWNAYETFLIANASQITGFESSLRSITYILPGRFKDAELGGEAIYAALHLLGMYHDSILFRIIFSRRVPPSDPATTLVREELVLGDLPKPSLHARYTSYWRSVSRTYRVLSMLVMVVEATQLLTEMIARRRLGKQRAWDVVVAIETVKALMRLSLVRASQERPIIQPPLPQREVDPAILDSRRSATPGTPASLTWRGRRTGLARRSIATLVPRPGDAGAGEAGKDVYEYMLSRTLTEQDVSPPPVLVRQFPALLGRVAETLWIVRPLLYVLALRRWGPRDVKPFALSLLLEVLARSMRRRSFVLAAKDVDAAPMPPMSSVSLMLNMLGIQNSFLDWLAGSLSARNPRYALAKPISAVEADEWAARDRAFWWYLLRGPVWYQWTRPKIAGLVGRMENRRIIGLLGSIIGDYLPLVDDYYYYSAV